MTIINIEGGAFMLFDVILRLEDIFLRLSIISIILVLIFTFINVNKLIALKIKDYLKK